MELYLQDIILFSNWDVNKFHTKESNQEEEFRFLIIWMYASILRIKAQALDKLELNEDFPFRWKDIAFCSLKLTV